MAMVALLFLSCVNTEDPLQGASVRLKLTGGIAVNQPADDATRAAVSASESLTVNSLRVLIFNNGALVSNKLFTSGFDVVGTGDNWIVSMNNDAAYVEARYGANDVYVVLNEEAGGLTASLNAVQTKAAMEALRTTGKVAYTDLIAVDDDNEPGFLMCVHDVVTIDSTKITLDMTGLGSSTYGFPMRRTMAKVVLESVIGGVDLDGKVLGLNEDWNNNAEVDQEKGDTDNDDLIATSAVHILGLDLVNVPTHYSWQQDSATSTDFPASPTEYRADPIPVAQYTGTNSSEYFARTWSGSITASGTVPFTREDQLFDMWRLAHSSGINSYEFTLDTESNFDPNKYYIWSVTDDPNIPQNKNGDARCVLTYAAATKANYTHYTMDNEGNITLWNGESETTRPGDYLSDFNSGNFLSGFKAAYGSNSGNYIPGTPVAGAPKDVKATIDPAVWVLDFNKKSYYIPENIPGDDGDYTKLRITASIAIPTAILDPEEVQRVINASGGMGDLVTDEAKLNMTDENIFNYLYAKAKLIKHPDWDTDSSKYGLYALCFGGMSRIYSGEVTVGKGIGQYDAITGMTAQKVTIEVPLNNDENATDHNIYRGHEYKVKLYVTKKKANWTPVAEANRSVTYHELPAMTTRGGESDLCIAAEVIATPVE